MKKWLHVVFILIMNWTNAQESKILNDSINLETVLFKLQKKFDARFSYESNLVKDHKVLMQIDTTSLQSNLVYLSRQTSLKFFEITLKKYIIKKNPFNNKTFTICGYLISEITKEPIKNARINVLNQKQSYFTNSKGYFLINNIEKNSEIEIIKTGQKSKIINASVFKDFLCKTILFKDRAVLLNEVIISNYLTKGFTKTRNGSIVSSPKLIEILPGLISPDVLQSVQLIPGIQSPDETATGLYIRGSTPDHNLVLYDGIRVYNYNHFFGMLSTFNPYILDKVTVGKSSSSLKYRSHISGVFDIKSIDSIPKKVEAGIGANMIYADAFLKIPLSKKVGIIASGRSSFSRLFQTISFDSYSDFIFQNTKITDKENIFDQAISKVNSKYHFEDYTLKLISKMNDKTAINFSAIFSNNKLDFVSQFEDINQLTSDSLTINNIGLNLNYSRTWTSQFQTRFSTSLSDYNFDYKGEEVLDAFFNYETEKRNHLNDVNFSFRAHYKFDKRHKISSGYDLTLNEIDYTFSNISEVIFENDFSLNAENNKSTLHEFYSEYTTKINKFFIETGIRVSHFSPLKKTYLQTNFISNYKLNNVLSLNFSVEKKNQFVSQILELQTQNLGLENQLWVSSNDQIPVLEKKQMSLSLVFKTNTFYFDIEAYIKKTKGISSLANGFNIMNNGDSQTKGIEVLLKKEIHYFNTTIGYTLSDNKFIFQNVNNGEKFPGDFDIRHNLSVLNSIKINKLELSLGWRFRTSRPFTPQKGLVGNTAQNIFIDYGKVNSQRLNNYSRFDFSSSYKFKPFINKAIKGSIGFSVLNIFNSENNLSRAHRIVVDLDNPSYNVREINKFSIRRTPNLNFRIEF